VVVRGVVRVGPGERGPDGARRMLTGSVAQIWGDVGWLAEQGVTEVFFDLNWDPAVGSPDVAPAVAVDRATDLVHALAPPGAR